MGVIAMAEYEPLFSAGHSACAGCTMPIVIRHVLDILGSDTVVVNATSCSEIISTPYPRTSWRVPYIHSLFENTGAVASGVVNALRAQGNDHTQVMIVGGDGSTYDIGFGAISGMLERNEDVLYVCYDNEAYMNTGVQRSGATPFGARTTTSPLGKAHHGKEIFKKPIVDIVAAHKVPYVASASIGYPADLAAKVRKAKALRGSRFLDVLAPCIPGWGISPESGIAIAKLAVDTGIWKLVEYEYGKMKLTMKPAQRKPVKDYLSQQARFRHLKDEDFAAIQAKVDEEWKTL